MNQSHYAAACSLTLDICPCCVLYLEETVVAVGCYELDPHSKLIAGSIQVYRIMPDSSMQLTQRINCCGILDMKFIHNMLIMCDVESNVQMFVYLPTQDLKLVKSTNLNSHPQNIKQQLVKNLYLSCYLAHENNSLQVCVGTDNGTSVFLCYDAQSLHELSVVFLYTHQYSVWSTHIENVNIFYTGSDDQALIKYDNRVDDKIVHTNKKSHTMGVSYITDSLITGSFDQYMRFWDPAMLNHPVEEFKREGGLWRIKENQNLYLNAIFAENFYEIVEINDGQLVERQKLCGHESLAYGCEWSPHFKTILTLSFYDKNIKLWASQ